MLYGRYGHAVRAEYRRAARIDDILCQCRNAYSAFKPKDKTGIRLGGLQYGAGLPSRVQTDACEADPSAQRLLDVHFFRSKASTRSTNFGTFRKLACHRSSSRWFCAGEPLTKASSGRSDQTMA
jgi:hypothetical protein